ncbi:MAG TPA: hypothetical protein VFB62_26325 [Polyangiaceae bacterium]|jgi:predicted esterase|nr:hypothetical protein [Polyangiaceae bacterium]
MRGSLLAAVLFAVVFFLTEAETSSVSLHRPVQTAHAKRVRPRIPTRPFRIGAAYVYPPLTRAPAPLVVMLHGMCGDGRGVCEFWNRAGRQASWLVCPNGNAACGGYSDWRGDGETKARYLDGVLAALDERHLVTNHDGILAGFSRGAFVARDVAYARPGRFRGLVLLGAALVPDPQRLKRSGILRVVLGAGDLDGARPTMQRAARVLEQGGIEARYVSLGRIPHALPYDLERIMRDALEWIRD